MHHNSSAAAHAEEDFASVASKTIEALRKIRRARQMGLCDRRQDQVSLDEVERIVINAVKTALFSVTLPDATRSRPNVGRSLTDPVAAG